MADRKIHKQRKKTEIVSVNNIKPSIYISILMVIVFLIAIIELIMYVVAFNSITSVQRDMVERFFQDQTAIQIHSASTTEDYERAAKTPLMLLQLNNNIGEEFKIKDIFIFDNNLNEIYTTYNDEKVHYECEDNDCSYKYTFAEKGNPKTFKLLSDTLYNSNSVRAIPVKVENKYNEIEQKNETYWVQCIIPAATPKYKNHLKKSLTHLYAILTILTLIIASILANSISKPLSKMEETISQISEGDLSGRLEYTKYYELNKLIDSYNIMADTLQRLYSSLENQVNERTKELNNAYTELKNTQAMMVHSEKMKSLGELVAGIMHEINNPINFIYGNMTHLSNYSNDLMQIIDEYTKLNDSLKPEEKENIENFKQELDYEFLKSDLPDLIKSCKEGAERAKNIIQDLKSFSRMESSSITNVDIVHEIDTTLNILYNKYKNKIEIHKQYIENVPKIEAFGGQLNQVFMNIIDNSIGAIKDRGDIWIRIYADDANNKMTIEIEDNGEGMSPETIQKIFDPFFTTKPVGQGTGLGLSITHKIIKNHQGSINVESRPGMGSKFIVNLPLKIDREHLDENLVSGESYGA